MRKAIWQDKISCALMEYDNLNVPDFLKMINASNVTGEEALKFIEKDKYFITKWINPNNTSIIVMLI